MPQGLANAAWAFVKSQLVKNQVISPRLEEVSARMPSLEPQNLINVTQHYATLLSHEFRVLGASLAMMLRCICEFGNQHLSNAAQASVAPGQHS